MPPTFRWDPTHGARVGERPTHIFRALLESRDVWLAFLIGCTVASVAGREDHRSLAEVVSWFFIAYGHVYGEDGRFDEN